MTLQIYLNLKKKISLIVLNQIYINLTVFFFYFLFFVLDKYI